MAVHKGKITPQIFKGLGPIPFILSDPGVVSARQFNKPLKLADSGETPLHHFVAVRKRRWFMGFALQQGIRIDRVPNKRGNAPSKRRKLSRKPSRGEWAKRAEGTYGLGESIFDKKTQDRQALRFYETSLSLSLPLPRFLLLPE